MKDNYVFCLIILQLLMTFYHIKTIFDRIYEKIQNFTFSETDLVYFERIILKDSTLVL